MKKLSLISSAVLLATPSLFATTVAQWTFETSAPAATGTTIGGIAAETGSGTASGVHAGSATVWSSPAGNGSTHSFSSNTWAPGDYYQYEFSTTGLQGLSLSYDQTSSSTGPKNWTLSYSLDGTTFNTITSYSPAVNGAPNVAWTPSTVNPIYTFTDDLGSLIDNSSTVFLRFSVADTTSEGGGTIAAGGTDRMDNVTVFTTPVPEPTMAALFGFGGLAYLLRMRKKNS